MCMSINVDQTGLGETRLRYVTMADYHNIF